MPILIKEVDWSQTSEVIRLTVKLKTSKSSEINVFVHSTYLKVSSPPSFFEAFLLHPIQENLSKCQILEGEFQSEVRFILLKELEINWDTLEKDLSKEEKAKVRELASKEALEEAKVEQKQRIVAREERKREEIRRATARDASHREEYESLIKKMKETELVGEPSKPKESSPIFLHPKPVQPSKDTPRPAPKFPVPKPTDLPAIRSTVSINVTFTQRNFITPKRESQEEEEREWLIRQKEARKATGFVEEDLRPEERNPQWLKEKGDQFFEQKNYLGAISAYSTAIRMTDQYFELFMNRAAAHMALENYQKCAEDCSKALELLTPPLEVNLQSRKTCLARRGGALVKLGLIRQGYGEIVAAVKLDPSDVVLVRDAEMLRAKLEAEE